MTVEGISEYRWRGTLWRRKPYNLDTGWQQRCFNLEPESADDVGRVTSRDEVSISEVTAIQIDLEVAGQEKKV